MPRKGETEPDYIKALNVTTARVAEIRKRVRAGEKKVALAAEYGISRQTLYTALG